MGKSGQFKRFAILMVLALVSALLPTGVSAQAVGSSTSELEPAPAASTAGPFTRGDVRPGKNKKELTAAQRKIANGRLVWGVASIGKGSVVRGGTVAVKSRNGRSLKATILTPRTNGRGYFMVSRNGLPKRFIVQVSGGQLVHKAGKKNKVKKFTTTLMAVVPAPQRKQKLSKVGVTLGTTIAARVGLSKWRDAAKVKATVYAKRVLGLPSWTTLGRNDRLLAHHAHVGQILAKSKNGKNLDGLVQRITKLAKQGGKKHIKLGKGKAVKYRPHRLTRAPKTRLGLEEVGFGLEVFEAGLSISELIGGGESSEIAGLLEAINERLTEIDDKLDEIETQLTSLQDEMYAQFAALSLQVSASTYDLLSSSNNAVYATLQNVMQAMQSLSFYNSDPDMAFMIPSALDDLELLLPTLKTNAVAINLQTNLIGSPSNPGLLGRLWNLILQSRATQGPATQAPALATTKLLTHEVYDTFEPVVSQWYLAQTQVAMLIGNLTLKQVLGTPANPWGSQAVWTLSGGQLVLTPRALNALQVVNDGATKNMVKGGECALVKTNPPTMAPCPGSFNSYLKVISNAAPQRVVGASQALDTTTSTMWANFGTAEWNFSSTPPFDADPLVNMPPTVTVTCKDNTRRTLRLDQDFFATVNGTETNCPWPGVTPGGPAGSNDTSTNWQLLSSDPGSQGSFTQTLGSLHATQSTGGSGLYSQLSLNAQNQNASTDGKIPGAHPLDFTSPSLFPDTGWGRITYSGGPWTQYMWPNVGPHNGLPLFGAFSPIAARRPAGDFFAFDLNSPSAPTLKGHWDPSQYNETGYEQAQYGSVNASLFASNMTDSNGIHPWYTNPAESPNRSHSYLQSLASINGNIVAGMAAPWWSSANMSVDYNPNSSGPATPVCASFFSTWYEEGVWNSSPTRGCTANVIGTRPADPSQYVWNQPASIG